MRPPTSAQRLRLPVDGSAVWAGGWSDYTLISPDGLQEVILRYNDEPPHGDSFHEATINGALLPGFIWGCYFAASPDSRYLAASWMQAPYERRTIIIDLAGRRYTLLPGYIYEFAFSDHSLRGVGKDEGACFEVGLNEPWISY